MPQCLAQPATCPVKRGAHQYPVILLRLLERYLSPKLGSLPIGQYLSGFWQYFTRFRHAEKLGHDGPFLLIPVHGFLRSPTRAMLNLNSLIIPCSEGNSPIAC